MWREIKPSPTSAGAQSGGIVQSYEQTTVIVFCEEAEEGVRGQDGAVVGEASQEK